MRWNKYLAVFLAASMTIAVPVAAQAQEAAEITVEESETENEDVNTAESEQPTDQEVPEDDEEDLDDTEASPDEDSVPKAMNAGGIYTELSLHMQQLLDEGRAQICDGWLILIATGDRVDPVSGEPFSKEDISDQEHQTELQAKDESVSDTEGKEQTSVDVSAENSVEEEGKTAAIQQTGDNSLLTEKPSFDKQTIKGRTVLKSEDTDVELPNPSKPVYHQDASVSISSGQDSSAEKGTIVPSPVLKEEFRFWTVAKEPAIAIKRLPIREEMKSNSRTIGILPENGVCYILSEEDNGWVYVESGTVRGFVRKRLLTTGIEASIYLQMNEVSVDIISGLTGKQIDETKGLHFAEEKIPASENDAFAYLRATVDQSIVEKDPALANRETRIREAGSEDSREIGTLKAGGLCYVIADRSEEWVYIESGDVRGFVQAEDLLFSDTKLNEEGKTLRDQIEERGESTYALASEQVPAKENAALYYTKTSIYSGAPGTAQREAILSYAAQFIGNPYVWGGTDPVNGADCSGFVQTIYKQFGYTLPRTAAEQAQVGEKITVEEAQPGDLIFYGNGNSIYHVVIYAGDSRTLEAKGKKYGIVSDTVNRKSAVWAIRVVDDSKALSYDIPEGLGQIHTFMGWQKVTNTSSQQYAFRKAAGMTFDPEGFAVVDNRYVIACTDTFGQIGDYIDFYQEDGTRIPCIIGDLKNQNDIGCNEWGHMNGKCIVEFVVDQNSWYGLNHANPGTVSCHPEWGQEIIRAERTGSFYGNL